MMQAIKHVKVITSNVACLIGILIDISVNQDGMKNTIRKVVLLVERSKE